MHYRLNWPGKVYSATHTVYKPDGGRYLPQVCRKESMRWLSLSLTRAKIAKLRKSPYFYWTNAISLPSADWINTCGIVRITSLFSGGFSGNSELIGGAATDENIKYQFGISSNKIWQQRMQAWQPHIINAEEILGQVLHRPSNYIITPTRSTRLMSTATKCLDGELMMLSFQSSPRYDGRHQYDVTSYTFHARCIANR